MSVAGKRWEKLPSFPNLPALYASAQFMSQSYTVYVTDLANVWVERLQRRDILKRSLTEDTSIDLIDGGLTQWSLFLHKLALGLDPSQPDHHLTTLEIAADSPTDLVLHITCLLPEPLKPLRWPLHLTKCPPSETASALVVPLIQAQQAHAHEMDNLVTKLKQKDAIIAKLVDKLEALGSGLDHVFNPLSGKRKISRSAAEDKIDGLAPFPPSDWHMTPSVFNTDHDNSLSASTLLNDWWSNLSSLPKAAIKNHSSSSVKTRVSQEKSQSDHGATKNDTNDEDDDDDFQVQSTPPQLLASRKEHQYATRDDDDSTDDGHDSPVKPENMPTREKSRAKLGAIGNRKKSPTAQGKPTSTPAAMSSSNEDTASEVDPDETMDPDATMGPEPESDSESEAEHESKHKSEKTSGGIGAIGGKKKSHVQAPSPVPAPDGEGDDETASGSDEDSDEEHHLPKTNVKKDTSSGSNPKRGAIGQIGRRPNRSPAPTVQSRTGDTSMSNSGAPPLSPKRPSTRAIGAIGGRRAPVDDVKKGVPMESPDSGNGGGEGKQEYGKEDEEEEEEDDKQKADRRRAELEKQLERKKEGSAAPARKKRRF